MKAAFKFFIYMGLIIVALYTSGCNSNSISSIAEEKTLEDNKFIETVSTGQQTANLIGDSTPNKGTTEIILYFSDGNGNLVPEKRRINKVAGIARATINELFRGPETIGLEPTIPPGTSLLDINISGGLCRVDLSKELITDHSGGSASENLTVYSLVNTLSQFQTIESVQILVEGEILPTLAGHLDISQPLVRDMELIKSI